MKLLHLHGEGLFILGEVWPFRFGGGPRIMSSHAVVMPIHLQGALDIPRIRVSVVDQDSPEQASSQAAWDGHGLGKGGSHISGNADGSAAQRDQNGFMWVPDQHEADKREVGVPAARVCR